MKNKIDELKKLAQENPQVFVSVIDNLVGIIDLLSGTKEYPEIEAKFKHSKELFRAECLLNDDLEKKGQLADRIANLICQVALFAIK